MKSEWIDIFCLNIIQIKFWQMLVLLWFDVRPKNQFKTNSAETSLSFWIFCLFVSYLCQVEGHGETLPKFSLKIVKNFPLQILKILCFLIWLCGHLSHGIWILDLHPSVKTLAFLDHCGQIRYRNWKFLWYYYIGNIGYDCPILGTYFRDTFC